MTDLQPFLAQIGLGATISLASGINDQGEIVGIADSHSFLLVPVTAVPEASTFALAATAGARLLIAIRKYRRHLRRSSVPPS